MFHVDVLNFIARVDVVLTNYNIKVATQNNDYSNSINAVVLATTPS